MDRDRKYDLRIRNRAAASLPPAMIGETGWDVLLALNSSGQPGLSLEKIASIVSVPSLAIGNWLNWLEDRNLVASVRHGLTRELGAAITRAGRELVESYVFATSGLLGQPRH